MVVLILLCSWFSGKEVPHDVRDKPPPQQPAGMVDARVALERPCRTLFIRNIQVSVHEIV
jgi:hypothetical protein